ncbi:MAG: exo-alpha-sialidase [Acidobacteria bacterium]|nr:exo-alpha-sialidase [Acidobacteriota bacterium]
MDLVDTAIRVSGQISHSGVGAATYNGKLYVVYSDHSTNGNLWLTYRVDQFNYSTPVQVPGAVVNNNPQLAVYNNKLYISFTDPNGLLYIETSTDGISFTNHGVCSNMFTNSGNPYESAFDSPSMAVFGGNLYIGFRTPKSGLGICLVTESPTHSYTASAYYPASFSLGEAPGLGAYNGKLYVAYKDTTGSNYIYLGESTNGVSWTFSNAATGNHTSSQPSLAVNNGVLYLGYRQNSSDFHFYYAYSTDGVYFTNGTSTTPTMGGPPALVVGPNGKLYNIFSQNSSSHYLSTAIGQ